MAKYHGKRLISVEPKPVVHEYRIIEGSISTWRYDPVKSWRGDVDPEEADRLGFESVTDLEAQGWELVSMTTTERQGGFSPPCTTYKVVMRRPKP